MRRPEATLDRARLQAALIASLDHMMPACARIEYRLVGTGAAFETFGPGPWHHFTPIPCGPYLVPTVALELRPITELCRDRPDRYQPILVYLQEHGCDLKLVGRGMGVVGLPQAVQENVLRQLREPAANHGD